MVSLLGKDFLQSQVAIFRRTQLGEDLILERVVSIYWHRHIATFHSDDINLSAVSLRGL